MTQLQLLGIVGSLRADSMNRRLLEAAVAAMPDTDWAVARLRAIPPYDADIEARGVPPAVARLKEQITEADGIVIASPEYNRSIPGVLKNAIDWASRPAMRSPLMGKPVVLMGASPGRGGARSALEHLRQVLESTLATPMPEALSVPQAKARMTDGVFDADLQRDLERVLGQLQGVGTELVPSR